MWAFIVLVCCLTYTTALCTAFITNIIVESQISLFGSTFLALELPTIIASVATIEAELLTTITWTSTMTAHKVFAIATNNSASFTNHGLASSAAK